MPTPNQGYNTPNAGTQDWHIPLNENFNLIDQDVTDLQNQIGDGNGGGGGGTLGPHSTELIGSADLGNPRGGFGAAVEDAISNGLVDIKVRGAWSYDSGIQFSSAQDGPNDPQGAGGIGIRIDATAAHVEYGGNGWAFTDDNTGDAGGSLRGKSFVLHGGFWEATGNPNGFIRIIDTGGCMFHPYRVRNFNNSNGDAAMYQVEEGNRWSEGNVFGGRSHLADIGIRAVASQGTSFQDNVIDHIHLSQTLNTGFDLTGNWIDCTFLNPTVIVGQPGAAFLRHNGNMGGTEIIAPELENASTETWRQVFCQVGPLAKRGPIVRGGDMSLNHNNIIFFNLDEYVNGGGTGWRFNMDRQSDQFPQPLVREQYSDNGATRQVIEAGVGITTENAPFPSGGGDWNPW